MSDPETQNCKMFIGGLSLSTDNDSLKEYFAKYGEVSDSVVMRDGQTRKSRGFGFITYTDSKGVDDCLADKPHVVDDKEVEVKRAVPREDTAPGAHQRTKKVFLGGLSPETTKEDIQEVVEQYGKVVDIQIMTEKHTNKPRGFGFAILENYDDVDKLCIKKFHKIRDRDVEVKKAISQEDIRRADSRGGRGSGNDYGYHGNYPPRDSYRGGPQGYDGSGSGRGGYDSYHRMMSGYEYPRRYTQSDYMRSADYYGMGGFGGEGRSASSGYTAGYGAAYRYPSHGYDMNAAYSNMYGQGAGMGSYSQTASGYGPSRGYGGGGGGDKDARGGPSKYHPYRRN